MSKSRDARRVNFRKQLVKCDYCMEVTNKSNVILYGSRKVPIHHSCAEVLGLFDEYDCMHCRDGGCIICRPKWFL